ncbi:hypothetical protein KR51_00026970 [Rubidibacter lacunae KORDI 51-2]|uniref:Uncharacterized protein n=1 Tax=Rubidibacter lacunae KORDI 51-2 TaxID=582515 RepID=U5DGI4_9CHRO|nr:hypothetical protein [Rubidibacter lacunae]ERN40711.1 hypothetical protein KR51_00026970 [Rubidibacter lacunae KORDI 51-2]
MSQADRKTRDLKLPIEKYLVTAYKQNSQVADIVGKPPDARLKSNCLGCGSIAE